MEGSRIVIMVHCSALEVLEDQIQEFREAIEAMKRSHQDELAQREQVFCPTFFLGGGGGRSFQRTRSSPSIIVCGMGVWYIVRH
jgi:hypothetical protein